MTTISIPYFRVKSGAKGGKRYFWDPSSELRRQGWHCLRLSDDYDTALAEARARNEELARWRGETGSVDRPRAAVAAGSVRAMILAYQASHHWTGRAPKTKYDYQWHLNAIDAWIGDRQAADITSVIVRITSKNFTARGNSRSPMRAFECFVCCSRMAAGKVSSWSTPPRSRG